MKKILAAVLAGAAALAVGSKWIKNRGWRGSSDPVAAVKDTANRVKERIRPSADAESEPSDDTAPEASDDEAVEALRRRTGRSVGQHIVTPAKQR